MAIRISRRLIGTTAAAHIGGALTGTRQPCGNRLYRARYLLMTPDDHFLRLFVLASNILALTEKKKKKKKRRRRKEQDREARLPGAPIKKGPWVAVLLLAPEPQLWARSAGKPAAGSCQGKALLDAAKALPACPEVKSSRKLAAGIYLPWSGSYPRC